MANPYVFEFSALTGGASGALDSLNTTSLEDASHAKVDTGSVVYFYVFNSSSSTAESSPFVIAPDTGTGRWLLSGICDASVLYIDSANNRVGINNTVPSVDLELGDDADADTSIRMNSDVAGSYIDVFSSGSSAGLFKHGSGPCAIGTAAGTESLILYTNAAPVIYIRSNGNVGVGVNPSTNLTGVTIEPGTLNLKETTTPTADTNYGKIYTKSDNKLYFQDGAGTEHEIALI